MTTGLLPITVIHLTNEPVNLQMKNMQNEPNFLETQMNVSPVKTKNYENKRPSGRHENKANTKPIQTQLAGCLK